MTATGVRASRYRPTVQREPCKTEPLHLAAGAEFYCMREIRIVNGRRFGHKRHWWEAKKDGFGWGEQVRVEWTT